MSDAGSTPVGAAQPALCRDYITKLYIISRVCLCDVIVHVALALLFVLMALWFYLAS